MKRRDFFKAITGFVAGIYAAFVPKAKAKEWHWIVASYNGKGTSDNIEIYPKRTQKCIATDMSVKSWVDAQFNPVKDLQLNEPFEGKVVGMCKFQGNLWIATERAVYRVKGISKD